MRFNRGKKTLNGKILIGKIINVEGEKRACYKENVNMYIALSIFKAVPFQLLHRKVIMF